MPRRARDVYPDIPHHITQRGNRGAKVFPTDVDRRQYLLWLREYADRYELEVWAYCLMTTHVHLVAVPRREDSLARAIGLLHSRYSQHLNRKLRTSGRLWQERFFSCPMDEAHQVRAAIYVERNPVRAGLVDEADGWHWSSADAHLSSRRLRGASWAPDSLLADWPVLLAQAEREDQLELIRKQTYTGQPLGDRRFVAKLREMKEKRSAR